MRIFCENMFFCTIFALVNNEKVCFYAEMLIFYSFFITFAANDEYSSFMMAECSAVGSALRSGRRGRAFESPHSDTL